MQPSPTLARVVSALGLLAACAPALRAPSPLVAPPSAAPAPPQAATPSERVIFVSHRGGRARLYAMAVNDGEPVALGAVDDYEDRPDVSPDGRLVTFASANRGPGENIFVLDLERQSVRQLTRLELQASDPRWSPDGSALAYSYPFYREGCAVWIVPAAGGAARRVTSPSADEMDDGGQAFVDGGRSLVFSRYDRRTRGRRLWLARVDGTEPERPLTAARFGADVQPTASHDGRLVVYRAVDYQPSMERFRLMHVGSWETVGEIPLPRVAENSISGISFSADDRRLFFSAVLRERRSSLMNEWFEIFSMALDGSDVRRLTSDTLMDLWPVAVPTSR